MDVMNEESGDRNETGALKNATAATLYDWEAQGSSQISGMLSDYGALRWVDRW